MLDETNFELFRNNGKKYVFGRTKENQIIPFLEGSIVVASLFCGGKISEISEEKVTRKTFEQSTISLPSSYKYIYIYIYI